MNAQLFEENFYSGQGTGGKTKTQDPEKPQGTDMDALMRILGNPETADLLKQLVKAMDN